MRQPTKCNCLNCLQEFVLDARNATRQKYCTAPECRAASKLASQASWLAKPENHHYHSGSEAVIRVRTWRQAHPDYSKGTVKRTAIAHPLQDILPALDLTPLPSFNGIPEANPPTLQDIMPSQPIEFEAISCHSPAKLEANAQESLQSSADASIQVSCNAPALSLSALQDFVMTQHLVLIGLISHIWDSTLQDVIASARARLYQLGLDIQGAKHEHLQTGSQPATPAPDPRTFQLDRSSFGAGAHPRTG